MTKVVSVIAPLPFDSNMSKNWRKKTKQAIDWKKKETYYIRPEYSLYFELSTEFIVDPGFILLFTKLGYNRKDKFHFH